MSKPPEKEPKSKAKQENTDQLIKQTLAELRSQNQNEPAPSDVESMLNPSNKLLSCEKEYA